MGDLVRCHAEPFLRTLRTKVLSCTANAPRRQNANDKPEKKDKDKDKAAASCFEVALAETILFPEGGGQPSDMGAIDGVPCFYVYYDDKGRPVHQVERALEVGKEVEVVVDWARRFDHMQQHSGQHLISAVALRELGWETRSWWLSKAPADCSIEFGLGAAAAADAAMAITPENVERLEELVNAAIRDSLPMTVHLYKTLDEAKRDPDIRLSRELPESLEGVVRMIKIAGVDMNACCGTHMASTASLQLVKFGGIQSSRGNARVFFVAGGRALAYFSRLQRVERELTAVLCASSSEHAALVRKLHTEARATGKTLTKTQEELAALLAERAVAAGGVASLLREEADFPLAAFVDAVKARAPNALGLAAAGEKGAAGQFVVFGPEALVAELGPKVAQLLEGKGGGRQGKFQGKSQSLARFGDALKLCAERLAAAPKQ